MLEAEKQYLLDARLMGTTREQGLTAFNDLCALVKATEEKGIRQKVVEARSSNETYFMRETAHYDALRNTIVPRLCELHAHTKSLRFWSAASSAGQEAYSLAMILLEMGLGDWSIEILGTDLSPQLVERARKGRYSQIEASRGLPSSFLLKYFRRTGLEWEIREEVRRMTRFETFDLRSSMSALGMFDVVFCRNVLLYFDLPAKQNIIQGIHGTLFHGGFLFLGSTETGIPDTEKFERLSIGDTTLYEAC